MDSVIFESNFFVMTWKRRFRMIRNSDKVIHVGNLYAKVGRQRVKHTADKFGLRDS